MIGNNCNSWEFCRNFWEIDGTKGAIVGNDVLVDGKTYPIQTIFDEVDGKKTIIGCKVETEPELVWQNPLAKYGLTDADDVSRASVYCGFYKSIIEDIEPEYGALNGRKDQEILIAIRESALKGSMPLELPLTKITQYEEQLHETYKAKYGHDPLESGINEARSTSYLLRRTQ